MSLIGATASTNGLKVYAEPDEYTHQRAIGLAGAQLDAVNLILDAFHGEWDYLIRPRG